MMKKRANKGFLYLAVILLGLFLIFFLGKKTDSTTKQSHRAIVSDGLNYFKKGLDVAGGTKLVYTINYDKYKEVYKDPAEFQAVKKRIEEIIQRNIDGRISKLGVSDYSAYYQTAGDKNYLIVEIGGVTDMDQAKETIGKTLELEFKLPSHEEPSKKSIAERKLIAQTVLKQVITEPNKFKDVTDERASENIYYNYYTGVTIAELPEIYQHNKKILDTLEIGKVYPELLE
ncbi:MAG: hypothetical protein GXP45_06900 [bacterium]|nr:hypothetical protein [bacterium]